MWARYNSTTFKELLRDLFSSQYFKKIVPEASATFSGYPSLSIHADHDGICRFEGKEDENYRKVSEILQRWTNELGEPSKEERKEVS